MTREEIAAEIADAERDISGRVRQLESQTGQWVGGVVFERDAATGPAKLKLRVTITEPAA